MDYLNLVCCLIKSIYKSNLHNIFFTIKWKTKMKKLFIVLITVLLTSSLFADGAKKYGKEISLKQKTSISEILKNSEKFEGKRVLVEGMVIGVCEKRGCWIELSSENNEKIRVKVNDGEIVFPMEAKGKNALVEGTVYSLVVGNGCEGNCEEGEGHDNDNCEKEKEARKVYMIKGLGAEIK